MIADHCSCLVGRKLPHRKGSSFFVFFYERPYPFFIHGWINNGHQGMKCPEGIPKRKNRIVPGCVGDRMDFFIHTAVAGICIRKNSGTNSSVIQCGVKNLLLFGSASCNVDPSEPFRPRRGGSFLNTIKIPIRNFRHYIILCSLEVDGRDPNFDEQLLPGKTVECEKRFCSYLIYRIQGGGKQRLFYTKPASEGC